MGLGTDELFADHAVLIPELVKGLPYRFFVASSIDALIHAIESYVSPKANPYTEVFSVKAMELILKGYMQIIEKGEEYRKEIIEEFVIGSNYAGIAFGNTGVGAVHALSYPLVEITMFLMEKQTTRCLLKYLELIIRKIQMVKLKMLIKYLQIF